MATPTQATVPAELADRYEELAQQAGRAREEVMLAVLAEYLAIRAEEDARVEAAIAAADQGEYVEADVVHADAEALIARAGLGAADRARIRAEVRAEMEGAYGVTLCE